MPIIKQTIHFSAEPRQVYEALMDSKKHSAFTGDKAVISKKIGGKISAYGGYIEGKNIELEPNKKIVQLWRASDWPDGHYSTTTFLMTAAKGGTKLNFTELILLLVGLEIRFYGII